MPAFKTLPGADSPRARTVARLLATALLCMFAVVAQAQEEVEDDTPFSEPEDDWRVWKLFTGQPIIFYGQINPAVVQYDDGAVTRTYSPVGNSNKTSRLGFRWHIRQFGDWSPLVRVEVGLSARPSKTVNIEDPGSNSWSSREGDLRKLELVVYNDRFGAFSFGQGSMATDGITEVDYSGTRLAAFSNVGQIAASQLLRNRDGQLSQLQIGDFIDNFEGANVTGAYPDGSRKMRFRYDTPNFNGFVFSTAFGNEVLRDEGETNVDAALTYEEVFGEYKFAAGAGYSWQSETRVLSGSATVLHDPSGLSLTAALGGERDGGSFAYLKAGVQRSFWSVGSTFLSVDFYRGTNIESDGTLATSYGLAMVQAFDKPGLEAYALIRSYDIKQPGATFDNGLVTMIGASWQF